MRGSASTSPRSPRGHVPASLSSSGAAPLVPEARKLSGGSTGVSADSVSPPRGLALARLQQHNFWSVQVESFRVTSGLVLSYTTYSVRWRFHPSGDHGVVEHRYSDFLSLFQHLQKTFPALKFAEFPEKKRFVTISDRTEVAEERLKAFRTWTKVFEEEEDLWLDAKVHRFFELPTDLRQSTSSRGKQKNRTLRGSGTAAKARSMRARGHRRGVSEFSIPVTFVQAKREVGLGAWEENSPTSEIRRSGSDMYLSESLGDDALEGTSIPIEQPIPSTRSPAGDVADRWGPIDSTTSTPLLRSSARERPRAVTPPNVPGDISPVFARKSLAKVAFPTSKIRDERIRSLQDFQIKALLGRGGFGCVFLATETSTGLVVAIKRMAKNTIIRTTKVEQVKMELSVLKAARIKQNRWTVQLHYSFQDEHYLYLAMQFCPGGDLRHLMENVEMDETTARLFSAEICTCVHYLHAMGYSHRDLKPDNFLISQRGHLKLADFGLSAQGFLESKERRQSVAERASPGPKEEEEFSQIVVYFPPGAGEFAKPTMDLPNSEHHFDLLVVPDDEEEEDWRKLKDDKGRKYQRIKVFVTQSTTCADVIDTIKLRLDIRKHVPYMLMEVAFINDHLHERVVKPDEHVQELFASFDQHKFVFRRIPQPQMLGRTRMRSESNYQDNVAQPLSQSRQKLYQIVGSPAYMAKEILLGEGYESEVDWWSVGCIIYEMLFGVVAFDGPTPDAVFAKILSFKELEFPANDDVSPEAKDLVSRLIAPASVRMGAKGGLEEVRQHPWFASVSWNELQYSEPPFLPELDSQLDTGYFPDASDQDITKYLATPDASTSGSSYAGSGSRSQMRMSLDSSLVDPDVVWADFDWSWFT